MAFGMGEGERVCRHYRISRTTYGAEKRREEREVFTVARSTNRRAFVLRLPDVHGDLQPVTSHYVKAAQRGAITLSRGLHSPSVVVTCFTIASALRNIARGDVVPAMYTLVENPEWTWEQFYRWVAANSGIEVLLDELPQPRDRVMVRRTRRQIARLQAQLYRAAATNRDVITGHLPIPPEIEYHFQIDYLRRKALSEVAQRPSDQDLHDIMLGPAPGRRLPAVEDREERLNLERRVRQVLDERLSQQSHNFRSGAHWAP
jgi:hypothetical protein